MIFDAAELDVEHIYKLLIGTIVPRAIGWVSTLSSDGVANLAPISFFTVVGRKPPVLSITLQHRSDGSPKDTWINIRDTGEFVHNMVSLPLAGAMHKSAMEFDTREDEFELVGLEKAPSVIVRPPRVALAPVAMECKVDRYFTVGDYEDHVVWGEVVRFHVRDDLMLENGRIDTAALAPVGRLAAEYTLTNNVFTTPLDADVLETWSERRMGRLDGLAADFSPVGQKGWSASGSVAP
ncbi:MAG: nitrilotriacetate monooxygenase [Bradyrhizobium sp.]|nr:nitrilotriacetate monooxygenase [Bradyrhizobium sp.]